MDYKIGDIVWVAEFTNVENSLVNHHYFVVVSDDGELVPADYFGFVISSKTNKSKEVSKYKYNEPIKKDSTNNLDVDSIVKCDQLFNIPKDCIVYRIGSVCVDDMLRFLEAYKNFLKN